MAYIYVHPESPVRSHLLFFCCNRDFMDTQEISSSLPSPNASPSKLLGKALQHLGGEIIHAADCEQGGTLHQVGGMVGKPLLTKRGFSSFKSKAAALKDLIIAVRAGLRTEINHQVFRLPSELIGIIGSHLGTQDRLKAGFACRHIRNALLGNRTLWTNIDCRNTHLALFFLELAKGCLLNVSITIPRQQLLDSSLFKSLYESATHIEALSVEYYTSTLCNLLSRARPSLKTLKIKIYHRHPTPKIPSREFSVLESLTFTGKPVVLHAPWLTRLTFERNLGDEEIPLFLSLLSGFPKLQELAVTHHRISRGNGPVVKLENLHTYIDHTNSDYCWTFGLYHRLSLPEKAKCSVIFRMDPRVIKPGRARRKLFRCYDYNPLSTNPDRIRVHSHRQDESQGETENRVDGLMEIVDSTTGHRFCSTFRSDHGPDAVTESLMETLPSGTEGTKMLCLESDHIKLCPSNNLLSNFPKLKTLILSCGDVVSYLQGLTRSNGFECPELGSIIICDQYSEGSDRILPLLIDVARGRHPTLQSVLLFSPESQRLGSPEVVGRWVRELKDLVASRNFRLIAGRRAESWNVDDYFLEGLRH